MARTIAELDQEFQSFKAQQETKMQQIESALTEVGGDCKAIRTRLDQWNGSIPHMTERLEDLSNDMKTYMKTDTEHAIKLAVQGSKIRLVMGVLGAVGTAVLGVIVTMLFF